jgi:hypothetical protein
VGFTGEELEVIDGLEHAKRVSASKYAEPATELELARTLKLARQQTELEGTADVPDYDSIISSRRTFDLITELGTDLARSGTDSEDENADSAPITQEEWQDNIRKFARRQKQKPQVRTNHVDGSMKNDGKRDVICWNRGTGRRKVQKIVDQCSGTGGEMEELELQWTQKKKLDGIKSSFSAMKFKKFCDRKMLPVPDFVADCDFSDLRRVIKAQKKAFRAQSQEIQTRRRIHGASATIHVPLPAVV